MGALTYPYTLTAGQPENVNQLNSNLSAISTVLNGGVDAANVTGAVFFEQYKRVFQATGYIQDALASGTKYILGTDGIATSGTAGTPGVSLALGTIFYLTASEYAVTGKTTKLLVKAILSSNATALGTTVTFGLYPVTVAGTADVVNVTAGTVTASSTVALATPSASTVTTGTSGDFTLPSDGAYALGYVLTGSPAANHASLLTAQLCVRNV